MECAANLSVTVSHFGGQVSYCLRDKDSQRTSFAKDALRLDSSNHTVDLRNRQNISDFDLVNHESKVIVPFHP